MREARGAARTRLVAHADEEEEDEESSRTKEEAEQRRRSQLIHALYVVLSSVLSSVSVSVSVIVSALLYRSKKSSGPFPNAATRWSGTRSRKWSTAWSSSSNSSLSARST